jgi:3'-5' exonuclease
MANYALFDIETRIDWPLLEQIEGCDRDEYLDFKKEKAVADGDAPVWIPYAYHLPIAIALGLVDSTTGELTRLGCVRGEDSETVCREFWGWLERFQGAPQKGTLVSFNGRGFDIPVLELAALRYGITAPQHWLEKWGNRYRFNDGFHFDVLDYLTGYGATRLRGGLSLLSALAGLPAKSVQHTNLEEHPLEQVQRWARNDVRRLYVVFQRLQLIRGRTQVVPAIPELEDEG